jgi:ribose transport system substrate-binding protein
VAALVGVSACGSSSSSSSPSHAAAISGGGPAVQAAETAVANYSKLPAPIVLPAVGKPIPKQVNLDLLTVATPSIQFLNGGVLAGAKALGWNVRTITPQTAPEAYSSALDSIVQQKPSAVIFFTPFPLTSFSSQLQQLKAAGVPVITAGASSYPVGGSSPVVADTSGANIFGPLATLMAQTIVADAKGAPDAAWVVDPSVPAWTTMTQHFKSEIESAGGKFYEIDVPETSIGKDAPTRIVSFLQAHPDVKYLSLVVGAYGLGLQQALAAAGLSDRVKLSDTDATPQDIVAIRAGQLNSTVGIETETAGWRLVDLMARTLARTPLPYVHVPSDFLVISKGDVALANDIGGFPHQDSAFLKAWGVA